MFVVYLIYGRSLYMDWYKTSQSDVRDLEKFLSLFRPQSLRGLASEAIKSGSFENFEKDFSMEIKHGTYWHITDDPNFQIDLNKGPRDMSSMSPTSESSGSGLMVTTHLENWLPYFKDRKYVAEIDMSNVDRRHYYQVSRGFGNEFFVTDPSKARVVRVLPLQQALRLNRYRHGVLPKSREELESFYNRVIDEYN
jgi:hypothetical protein